MIRMLIFAALLASVVVPTSPRLLKNLRVARELRPLSMDARREKLMPDSYAAIEKIRTTVPMSERIALMGVSRESLRLKRDAGAGQLGRHAKRIGQAPRVLEAIESGKTIEHRRQHQGGKE